MGLDNFAFEGFKDMPGKVLQNGVGPLMVREEYELKKPWLIYVFIG